MGFAPQPGWMFPTLGILFTMLIIFVLCIRLAINKAQREYTEESRQW